VEGYIMPNTQTITITKEAKETLEKTKSERQGYTECLLASEAIIEKYGRHRHTIEPLPILPPQTADGDPVEFAARTVMAVGSARAALRSLDGYIAPGKHEFKAQVQNALMDMIERGCDRGKV
jgi:predicted CopG family antitoxin